MKKLIKRENFYLLGALFVLCLFAYMTYQTPLAGDDWGYALNGSLRTPIKMALNFYQTWSGRFFSELWGMLIPNHKWIWNIINPLLFLGIYIFIYKIADIHNKPISCILFILAFMLSVDDNLRMETYTWIMGTTYVIPLLFSLIYFFIIDKQLFSNGINKFEIILSNILLFVIGLMMENIAATMIVAIIILIIYAYLNKKATIKYLSINLFFSLISFTIMRLSPGSASRLVNDNAKWVAMSLFEKLSSAYPNFLEISFINNNYAIGLFSLIIILLIIFSKKQIPIIQRIIHIFITLLAVVTVFSFVLGNSFINNSSSLYSFIFWPLYIINSFVILFNFIEDEVIKHKTIFYLMVGGCSVLVMLFSPIYGSRSALYLIYYLIVVSILVLDNLNINKKIIYVGLCAGLCFIIADRSKEYLNKYHLVGIRQRERLEIIKYYQEHPEDEEAWIPRFPIYTIHGADIEPEDTYHLETFKEYYNLPQDADKIIFYFVEDN